jgi:tetratricopeptide (TPR) repeat protein
MKYLTLINGGTNGRAAAQQAFGNLQKLNGEIESYYRKPALPFSRFPASKYAPKSIEMRGLRPGEAAVIEARMQSKVGVDRERGARVLEEIRRVAAQYPNEPLVLSSLAEAEIDMQHYGAAMAASDRALAIDPRWTEAMIFKGRAIAEDPANKGKAEMLSKARSLFVAANKIDTEDPEPLKLYWDSFRRQGVQPTASAIAGLHYASRLVPQDMDMRMLSALQYLRDGQPAEARERLATIAFNPHSGETADKAQEIVDKIDAKDSRAALAIVEEMFRRAEAARAKASAAK